MGAHEKKSTSTLLTEEELQSAAEQIAYDLGVNHEKALAFAKEAQKELCYERDALCTRETVVTAADTKHLPDEDVPAKLEPLNQGTNAFPGENMVKGVVNFAKNQYGKVKN